MLPQSPSFCYGVGCPRRILTPVQRFLALFVAAAFCAAAAAADKPAKARVHKAAGTVEVRDDGGPLLKSTGVLVMDVASGQTLYSKNADQSTPIASITKLMTAMVVLDAKLGPDDPIQITSEDIDLIKNT